MPNYQDGKIYTIRNYTDNSLIYVGSTTAPTLARRLAEHRTNCKENTKNTLYNHIINNNWSNWYIELHSYYPCNNRAELNRREGEVIREISTINKNIAGRTIEEYRKENADKIKEYQKEYYENNKEKLKELREENADKIKEYRNKYREENAVYFKKWREENADKINKNKEKVCCDICGAFTIKYGLKRHQKTIKCTGAVR